jgi:hypothetical protein
MSNKNLGSLLHKLVERDDAIVGKNTAMSGRRIMLKTVTENMRAVAERLTCGELSHRGSDDLEIFVKKPLDVRQCPPDL